MAFAFNVVKEKFAGFECTFFAVCCGHLDTALEAAEELFFGSGVQPPNHPGGILK
jgi:hypothetical protein